jgi:hypothetical protein
MMWRAAEVMVQSLTYRNLPTNSPAGKRSAEPRKIGRARSDLRPLLLNSHRCTSNNKLHGEVDPVQTLAPYDMIVWYEKEGA